MNKFLFYLSARMFGEACVELFIYRKTPVGRMQVYLLPRPKNDPFYPNQLHMPGARKIPTETYTQTLTRAIRETPYGGQIKSIQYIKSDTYKAKRGVEYADIRGLEVAYQKNAPNFYDVDNLPSNMIEHHRQIIDELIR